VDWNIDVKTNDQFEEMDISTEKKKELNALFNDNEYDENIEEISKIAELPGISERLAEILMQNGIELIETLVSLSAEDLSRLEGVTAQDVEKILSIISESVDIIEQEEEEEEEEGTIEEDEGEQEASDAGEKEVVHEETYECPECGHPITIDMTSCPNCGVGLSFEVEEDDEESEDEEEQEV
jgi:N utilization substance protein A